GLLHQLPVPRAEGAAPGAVHPVGQRAGRADAAAAAAGPVVAGLPCDRERVGSRPEGWARAGCPNRGRGIMKGNDHARSVRKERGSGLKGEKPWAKAKGALLVVLLSSFVLVPLFALAQPPAGAPAARMQYTNRQQFRLKIDLGDTDRQKL